MIRLQTLLSVALLLGVPPAGAGQADVVDGSARCKDRTCAIAATVAHADAGWDHYANHWRVLLPDGTELARRVLHHPHVEEQPFNRSLDGVTIPHGVTTLVLEAHDSVHGYGGARFELALPER